MNAGLTFGRANKIPTWRELFTWPDQNRMKPGDRVADRGTQVSPEDGDRMEFKQLIDLRTQVKTRLDSMKEALQDAGPEFKELIERQENYYKDLTEQIQTLGKGMQIRQLMNNPEERKNQFSGRMNLDGPNYLERSAPIPEADDEMEESTITPEQEKEIQDRMQKYLRGEMSLEEYLKDFGTDEPPLKRRKKNKGS